MSTPKKKQQKAVQEKPNKEGKLLYLYAEQLITDKGFNTRYDMGDLNELALSILHNGLLHPILGYATGELNEDGYPIYTIIDGHRRFAAMCKLIESGDITNDTQAIPFKKMPEEWDLVDRTVCMLNVSGHSKQFEILEMALGIKRIKELRPNVTNAEIAERIGKSAVYVGDCLLLLSEGNNRQLDQIRSGVISASAVISLLKEARKSGTTNEELDEVIEETISEKGKATKRDVERKLKARLEEEETPVSNTRLIKEEPLTSRALSRSAYEVLVDLKKALKDQKLPAPITDNFEVLSNIIDYVRGDKDIADLLSIFYVIPEAPTLDLDEEAFQETKAFATRTPIDDEDVELKPSRKTKKPTVDDTDDDDIDIEIDIPVKQRLDKSSPFSELPQFKASDLDLEDEE